MPDCIDLDQWGLERFMVANMMGFHYANGPMSDEAVFHFTVSW